MDQHQGGPGAISPIQEDPHEEGAGLIAHAQEDPSSTSPIDPYDRYKEDQPYESDLGYRGAARFQQAPESYQSQTVAFQDRQPAQTHAVSSDGYYQVPGPTNQHISAEDRELRRGPDNTQQVVGAALWGANPHQHPGGPMI